MSMWSSMAAYLGFAPFGAVGIASPYTDPTLKADPLNFVAAELLDFLPSAPITRAQAMGIPPVAKGRQVICGTIAPLTLVKRDASGPVADQPSWLYRTRGILSPSHRITWTLDDLIFYGDSVWLVERAATTDGTVGEILDAVHVPYSLWELGNDRVMRVGIDMDGNVFPEKRPVSSTGYIYFPSHIEGLLMRAAVTLAEGAKTHKAVADRAATPIPVVELHQTDADANLTTRQAEKMVKTFAANRHDPDGVVTFTPAHIELKVHGDKQDLAGAIEAKNGIRVDVASHLGLPAAVLDGSLSTASLTYSTQEGAEETLQGIGLGPWMDTVTGRLSQDDVTPAGTNIRFDASALFTPNPAPTGPNALD